MDDSALPKKAKAWLAAGIMVGSIVAGCVFASFASTFRQSSPNDGIGRYQMVATNHGTLIIMDTVTGTVGQTYNVDDLASREPPHRKPSH